ncbi:hypothetical protein FE257_000894, partial [Aspergillus nanangensis]
MEPTQAWIAPLIENCLYNYSKGLTEHLNVEDDESNLRFSIASGTAPYHALINSWPETRGISMPNISDTKTQIDAILTRRSMDEYERRNPDKLLNKDSKGYWIELLEFEVVLEHSTSEPNVHLCVQRFTIAWGRKRFKGPPQGRKVKKNVRTQQWIQRIFQSINTSKASHETDPAATQQFGEFSASQRDSDLRTGATQDFLLSQVPAPLLPHSEHIYIKEQTKGANPPNKLLGYLQSHDRTGSYIPGCGHETIPDGQAPCTQTPDVTGTCQQYPFSQEPLKSLSQHEDRGEEDSAPVSTLKTTISNQIGSPRIPDVSIATDDGTKGHDKAGSSERALSGGPMAKSMESSYAEDIREENAGPTPQKGEPSHNVPGDLNSVGQRSRQQVDDPWCGLDRILKNDIMIPSNQAKLLQQHERLWVPPQPGKPVPQGSVPPELLTQWNRISLQRQCAAETKESSPEPVQREADEAAFDPVPSTPQTKSSPEVPLEYWSESSPEHFRTPRRRLPESSSPIKPSVRARDPNTPRKEIARPHQETPNATDVNGASRASPVPAYTQRTLENHEEQSNALEISSVSRAMSGVDEPAQKSVSTDNAAPRQSQGNDSDAESEDSAMDTSVPCPLGVLSQAYSVSQSEPSLPEQILQERVQVVETPGTNFGRLNSFQPLKQTIDPTDNRYKPSPGGAKSSSQSRIFNTYATSDTGPKETQDTLTPSQSNHSEYNAIDIMGTQLGNENWSIHSEMPHSSSGLVQDSPAAPKDRQPSPMPDSTSQSDVSSKPFSSHNEMISSIESQGKESVTEASQASTHDMSIENTVASMKRSASAIDTEDILPMKRNRLEPESKHTHKTESKTPISNIMSRRQIYIRHSEDRAEAQTVFEKFRNDYPGYLGDFAHFSELCSKLQALRLQGDLQRSFLWDDFIIKHLEDYPRHIEDRLSMEAKTLTYEEFFAYNYSKPSYKRRSLTADGINITAAQYESIRRSTTVTRAPPHTQDQANTSFTGSLVEKFSNFHAHSFGPADLTPSVADVDRISTAMSSPIPQNKDKTVAEVSTPESDIEMPPWTTSPTTPQPDLLDPKDLDTASVISETESEDLDPMDESHETASVELGCDEPEPPSVPLPEPSSREVSEEPAGDSENWFTSLRHIRTPGPGWWDDRNTPIKKWARADQNVLSARVMRPGWARTPVDEMGVIDLS